MNIADLKFKRLFKIPKQLIKDEEDSYVSSVFCYLSERRNCDLICISLRSCLEWHKLKVAERISNNGSLTPAGRILNALLRLQELGYILNFDPDTFKNNQHIELKCNPDNFSPKSNFIFVNNIELDMIIENLHNKRLLISEILKVFFDIKKRMWRRYEDSIPLPMASYCYYKTLCASTNISLAKLKSILEYLSNIDLLKILILPRKKYLSGIKRRPMFMALTYNHKIVDGSFCIDSDYDVDDELIDEIALFESCNNIDDMKNNIPKARIYFANATVLGKDAVDDDMLINNDED